MVASNPPVETPKQPGNSVPAGTPAAARDFLAKGDDLRRQLKWQEASESYTAALRIAAKLPQAHFGLGIAMNAMGKPAGALTEFRLAAEGMPQNSDALYSYGQALVFARKLTDALPWMKKAVYLDPANLEKRDQYIEVLLDDNMVDAAIEEANKTKTVFGEYKLYYERVARALETKGQEDAAVQMYRRGAAELTDKHMQALLSLSAGKLLWKLGKKDEARKEMDSVIALSPDSLGPQAKQLLEMWK
jgi:tetratricopeptide (TPR) repeat protein